MKANELPEKVYIHKSQYWGLMTNVQNITKNGIEYTRTDAFIEKACDWFRRLEYDDTIPPYETTEEFIKAFKKYMKGE